MSYLRTKDNAEIVLIIERPGLPRALIEIKSNQSLKPEQVSKLNKLSGDFANSKAYRLGLDKAASELTGRKLCIGKMDKGN